MTMINGRKFQSALAFRARKAVTAVLAKTRKADSSSVLFGARYGSWYMDNSRHLFEWMLRNRTELRPVWMTKNREIYGNLTAEGRPVADMAGLSGLSRLARARVGACSNSIRDIALYPSLAPDRLQLVALRHGRSVKKVRFARQAHRLSPAEAEERACESRLIARAISTSEFVSDIQEECLRIGREKHAVTGYPRNDVLLAPTAEMNAAWERFLDGAAPRKTLLYGPSWRHGREPTRFFPFDDFDETALTELLDAEDMLLLLRPHVNDMREFPEIGEFLNRLAAGSARIRLASHHIFPDVNMFLPFVDLLITDYSALYHDFLLLDRPMIFIPYDYEDFAAQNGFLYDYHANLPGPAVGTFREFCDRLERSRDGDDGFADARRRLTDKIHTYRDARSCERVAALIRDLLEG